jgi:hypothetical protein
MHFPRLNLSAPAAVGHRGRAGAFPRAGVVVPAACNKQRLQELQAEVNQQCKGWPGCKGDWSCADLWDYAGGWQVCANARHQINNECFDGGDPGHQQAAADAEGAAQKCQGFYNKYCT